MAIPSEITITSEEYLVLRSYALAADAGRISLTQFLAKIEERNDFRTYRMSVRWINPAAQNYPTRRFPDEWPPRESTVIERTDRPIAKQDVLDAIAAKDTLNPIGVLVTEDPSEKLGWTELAVRFP